MTCSHLLLGQVTFVIDEIPENTSVNDKIFISGNFEGWTGGQDNYKLKPLEGKYVFTFTEMDGRSIEFKFTRGSWATVEVDNEGLQMENRTYSFTQKNDTVNLSISQWDDFIPAKSTASKNVHVLAENYDMLPLNKNRRVWIYLPEEYENNQKKYPVLYMHDGQNLFDQTLSFSGEWEVDETLDKLGRSQELELIVVAIDHGGNERIDEYSPWSLKNYSSKQEGDAYVKFITQNLKPYIDQNYRTLPDRSNTGIMGSSLGGLISFYAALKYPETYGMAGVFSPSFEVVELSSNFVKDHGNSKNTKLYFMAGDQESKHMKGNMLATVQSMIKAGFPEKNIKSRMVKGGEHNEKLWREEFPAAIEWLFKNE